MPSKKTSVSQLAKEARHAHKRHQEAQTNRRRLSKSRGYDSPVEMEKTNKASSEARKRRNKALKAGAPIADVFYRKKKKKK